jgi:hypothetical protein
VRENDNGNVIAVNVDEDIVADAKKNETIDAVNIPDRNLINLATPDDTNKLLISDDNLASDIDIDLTDEYVDLINATHFEPDSSNHQYPLFGNENELNEAMVDETVNVGNNEEVTDLDLQVLQEEVDRRQAEFNNENFRDISIETLEKHLQCPLNDDDIRKLLSFKTNENINAFVLQTPQTDIENDNEDDMITNIENILDFDNEESEESGIMTAVQMNENLNEETYHEEQRYEDLSFQQKFLIVTTIDRVSEKTTDKLLDLCAEAYDDNFSLARNIKRTIKLNPNIYVTYVFMEKKNPNNPLIMTVPKCSNFQFKHYPEEDYELVESMAFVLPTDVLNHYMKIHNLSEILPQYKNVQFTADGVVCFKSSAAKVTMGTLQFPFCEKPTPCMIRTTYNKLKDDTTSKTRSYQLYFTLMKEEGFKPSYVVADSAEMQVIRGMSGANSRVGCETCFAIGEGRPGIDYSWWRVLRFQSNIELRSHEKVKELKSNLPHTHQLSHKKKRGQVDIIREQLGETRRSPLEIFGDSIDMIKVCAPDFFHMYCLGMAKFFLTDYLEYIKGRFKNMKFINRLDEHFSRMTPPSDFRRGIRKLSSEFGHFKGREFFLLSTCYALDILDVGKMFKKEEKYQEMILYVFILGRYWSIPDAESELILEEEFENAMKDIVEYFRDVYELQINETRLRQKLHKAFMHPIHYRKLYGSLLKVSTESSESMYGVISSVEKKCCSRKANTLSLKSVFWRDHLRHSCRPLFEIKRKKRKKNDSLFYKLVKDDNSKLHHQFYVLHEDTKNPSISKTVHARRLKTSNLHISFGDTNINLSKLGAYYLDENEDMFIEESHYEEIQIDDIDGKAIINNFAFNRGTGRKIIVHVPREFMLNN